VFLFTTSRVPAVLLQETSTNAYISYNLYCQKTYHRPFIRYVSLKILENNNNYYYFLFSFHSFFRYFSSWTSGEPHHSGFKFLIIIIIISKPKIFTGTRNQDRVLDCGLTSCNIPTETNNFYLGVVLRSSIVSELQKLSSPGLKLRTGFRDCDLCFYNLLEEANNFGSGAVLLSCLVCELHEPPSSGLELRTVFRDSDLSEISFFVSMKKHSSLVRIDLSVLELQAITHTHTIWILCVRLILTVNKTTRMSKHILKDKLT
jgi:hypothetical protein